MTVFSVSVSFYLYVSEETMQTYLEPYKPYLWTVYILNKISCFDKFLIASVSEKAEGHGGHWVFKDILSHFDM